MGHQKKALAKASAFFNDVFRERNVMCASHVMGRGTYLITASAASYITMRSITSLAAKRHTSLFTLEIAQKEASETGYWLELLYRTKYIDDNAFKVLSSKCASIRIMLIASAKTAKENQQ